MFSGNLNPTALFAGMLLLVPFATADLPGDLCSQPILLEGPLPLAACGTTAGYADDYEEACPYTGSSAPDVVYAYTPNADIMVEITFCSGFANFDTKLYVYDACPPEADNLVACNDDGCAAADGTPWVSVVRHLRLRAGVTYYIVVDGFGDQQGDFTFLVDSSALPECPVGGAFSQLPTLNASSTWCADDRPVYDNFVVAEEITAVRFWALQFYMRDISPCAEYPVAFALSFFDDDQGQVGTLLREETFDISPVQITYVGYNNYYLLEFTVPLSAPLAVHTGWLQLAPFSWYPCYLSAAFSNDGDQRMFAGEDPHELANDLAFCLITDGTPLTGACCDDFTGVCSDDALAADCLGAFFTGLRCADLPSQCAQLGACCNSDDTCALTTASFCARGDLNCDGWIDVHDINRFVVALTDPAAYQAQQPDCPLRHADINGDGAPTFADINPFVTLLCCGTQRAWSGPGTTCAGCPPQPILVPADLPEVYYGSTENRPNSFAETCIDPFDSGPEIVYTLHVTAPVNIDVELDPGFTDLTGMFITDTLPPVNCLSAATDPTANDLDPYQLGCTALDPGTYYLIVDGRLPIEQFSLTIANCTPVIGRCCYDDPPQCANTTSAQCGTLGGSWTPGLTCGTPCPSRVGEDCAHAEPLPFEAVLDLAARTADDLPAPCSKYTMPEAMMTGDTWFTWVADISSVLVVSLLPAAADDVALVAYDGCGGVLLDCADELGAGGVEQLTLAVAPGQTIALQCGMAGVHPARGLTLLSVVLLTGSGACCLADGTCLIDNGAACIAAGGSYQGDGTDCGTVACPFPTSSRTCDDPVLVPLNLAALPYVDVNTTVGRGDDYADTCLGSFDSGADIIYELQVSEPLPVHIRLDPRGASYTGFVLGQTCPPSANCERALQGTFTAAPYALEYVVLLPGTYYLLIDRWLTPSEIPEFELRIELADDEPGACCVAATCVPDLTLSACLAQGGAWYRGLPCAEACVTPGTCAAPIELEVNDWASVNTCGHGNDWVAADVLGRFSGGQDVALHFAVAEAGTYTLRVDPGPYVQFGVVLSSTCPPTPDSTLFAERDLMPGCVVCGQVLLPGDYYITLDRWPQWEDGHVADCGSCALVVSRE